MTHPAAHALELLGISCTFAAPGGGPSYTAVANATLHVAAGEFVSVVGPTGCGKSTLLNVAAGLLAPSAGQVRVFGQPLQGLDRRAGYMFQSDALLPWRSALANVMLGLQYRAVPDADARAQAQDWRCEHGVCPHRGADRLCPAPRWPGGPHRAPAHEVAAARRRAREALSRTSPRARRPEAHMKTTTLSPALKVAFSLTLFQRATALMGRR